MDYLWHKFSDWNALFSGVFISSDLNVSKPNSDFFRICQQQINIPFAEICLIDDSIENIQAVKSLGMQVILFKTADDLK